MSDNQQQNNETQPTSEFPQQEQPYTIHSDANAQQAASAQQPTNANAQQAAGPTPQANPYAQQYAQQQYNPYAQQQPQQPYAQNGNPYVQQQYTQNTGYTPSGAPYTGQQPYTQPNAQQQYNPYMQQQPYYYNQKSKLAAGLLGIFLGGLGVHNFYLGFTEKAVIQLLLTLFGWLVLGIGPVVAWIWGLVEAILILCSKPYTKWHRDAQGYELRD